MKGNLLKYCIPLVVILVAAFQFYKVYFEKLTRWKGGGFGMYAEMHATTRQFWVNNQDSIWEIKYQSKPFSKSKAKVRSLVFNPDKERLRAFAKEMALHSPDETITIEIWEPFVDPKTQTLSKKKIAHAKFPE